MARIFTEKVLDYDYDYYTSRLLNDTDQELVSDNDTLVSSLGSGSQHVDTTHDHEASGHMPVRGEQYGDYPYYEVPQNGGYYYDQAASGKMSQQRAQQQGEPGYYQPPYYGGYNYYPSHYGDYNYDQLKNGQMSPQDYYYYYQRAGKQVSPNAVPQEPMNGQPSPQAVPPDVKAPTSSVTPASTAHHNVAQANVANLWASGQYVLDPQAASNYWATASFPTGTFPSLTAPVPTSTEAQSS
uniref:YTH domain-containing protein n=1 Tax=Angiostrongylus cantonensis TaxID=6313 RepID=A0A0K0DE06_ANGCA